MGSCAGARDIAILVYTSKKYHDRTTLIEESWGRHLDNLFLFTDEDYPDPRYVKVTERDDYSSHIEKTFHALLFARNNLLHLSWFYLGCDDRYLFVDNLVRKIQGLNKYELAAYGEISNCWPHDRSLFYPLGGAGILLSKYTLLYFCKHLPPDLGSLYRYGYCDVAFGALCRDAGIKLINLDGVYSQPPEFYGITSPQEHLTFHYIRTKEQFDALSRLDRTGQYKAVHSSGSPPIVLIHYGDSDYLKYTIAQARYSNPKAPIILIGDEHTAGKYPQAQHIYFRPLSGRAFAFARTYRHLNTNHEAFEKFCLMRWFILWELMRSHGLERAVYIDSDVLLYDDVAEQFRQLREFDLAITGVAPPVMVNNPDALEAFCSFIEACYTDDELFAPLAAHYASLQQAGRPGGVCDMTIWQRFMKQETGWKLADLSEIRSGVVHDRNILCSDGFLMDGAVKRVVWEGGKPYGIGPQGELVRFASLHFHGPGKEIMGKYLTEREP